MTNATYYSYYYEWKDTDWEHDDFMYGFVNDKYPQVYEYCLTNCVPEVRDIQIILKEWQKTHAPIKKRITRIMPKEQCIFSLLP